MEYTKHEVLQYIDENDVKFIKLFFSDIFGTIKSVSVQPSILHSAFETGVSFDASAVKGFLNVANSDLFLIPDSNTLSVLPWRPQQGRVARLYCNINYPNGEPFEGDTRRILKSVVSKASERGLDIKIGTECEFYLFKLDENSNPVPIPHDNAGYCDLAPMDKGENVRRNIIQNLLQMGIEVETSHHETGPGQNEVDFRYDSALFAADKLATFKTTVKTIANQSGLFASFMPKPLEKEAGSGLHVNISVFKDGRNLFEDAFFNGFSPEAASFTAGILAHIKEITAFLNPLNQSYERLGHFEAPSYVSWSCQNRSQLIRVPAAKGNASRIELRSPDPSCNQYLALALIIAAGLDGLEKEMKLPAACDFNLFDSRSEETAKKLGLSSLPSSLEMALELAKNSQFVRSVIPEITLNEYVRVRTQEMDPPFGSV